MPTLKGTEVLLSYVQCFLYLVSSSINVSVLLHGWILSGQTLSYITLPFKVCDVKRNFQEETAGIL